MNDYEKLVSFIQEDVTALEADSYDQTSCYGLYRDGKVYTEEVLSTCQERNILAKEYEHYQASVDTTLNQNYTENRKQELKAYSVALEQPVTLDDLIHRSETGLSSHYSCAEFLEIDVEALKNVTTYYRQKYDTTYLYEGQIFELRDYSVMVLNTGLTRKAWNRINRDFVPCLEVFWEIQERFLYQWLICPTSSIGLGISTRANVDDGQDLMN